MKILVTGGAGYIGSHTCVELLNTGHEIVVIDNLCNSSIKSLNRVEEITGKKITFYNIDLLKKDDLCQVFDREKVEVVVHFAGLKSVNESIKYPLKYYNNNLIGTFHLCDVMKKYEVKNFVFSSSATVYGSPNAVPVREEFPLYATNPYGKTKLILEEFLRDMYVSDNEWSVILLRYFNPVGAHKSGKIGENPKGIPNNLMPYITQVAMDKLAYLGIFGDDYDTPDGTGVRDYIHVVDLAIGHVKAVEKLREKKGVLTYNLGAGKGYSVLDMVRTFEKATGVKIPYEIKPRRTGDIPACYADPAKAEKELNWVAKKSLWEMCEDSWRWQNMNPNGYD